MRRLFFSFIPVIMAAVLLTLAPAVAQEKTDPVESITIAEMRDHIFYLASDALEGRDTASAGYKLAAQYAASQFHAAGLQPLIGDAEGNKSFLQPVKLMWSQLAEGTALVVSSDGEERTYGYPEMMVPAGLAQEHADGFNDVRPVFLGHGIEEPDLGWDDFEGLDVEGRIGIMLEGAPLREGKPVLPEDKHQFYMNIGRSANQRLMSVFNHKMAGVIVVLSPQSDALWNIIVNQSKGEQMVLAPESGEGGFASLPATVIAMRPETMADEIRAMGVDPSTGEGEYRRGEMEGVRLGFKLATETRPVECRNVVALLEGCDPELKDEYVVVSAHLDHLGVRDNGDIMNGADDNASGSAAVIEAAEAAALDPPKRSVIFVLYTAEEKGLLGSRHFVERTGIPPEKIVLNINADMVGRNSPEFPDSILVLTSEKRRQELLEMVKKVAKEIGCENLDLRLHDEDQWSHGIRSDQSCFEQKDIPYVLVTRGFMQPDYHRPSDDPETINYEKVAWSSKLMYAMLMAEGNRN
ncbi:MAG TPA: M28 family peptidase [Acidobacteriota bacterium]|nr:M28 family peptidase [Acidobacteriota bacterium]